MEQKIKQRKQQLNKQQAETAAQIEAALNKVTQKRREQKQKEKEEEKKREEVPKFQLFTGALDYQGKTVQDAQQYLTQAATQYQEKRQYSAAKYSYAQMFQYAFGQMLQFILSVAYQTMIPETLYQVDVSTKKEGMVAAINQYDYMYLYVVRDLKYFPEEVSIQQFLSRKMVEQEKIASRKILDEQVNKQFFAVQSGENERNKAKSFFYLLDSREWLSQGVSLWNLDRINERYDYLKYSFGEGKVEEKQKIITRLLTEKSPNYQRYQEGDVIKEFAVFITPDFSNAYIFVVQRIASLIIAVVPYELDGLLKTEEKSNPPNQICIPYAMKRDLGVDGKEDSTSMFAETIRAALGSSELIQFYLQPWVFQFCFPTALGTTIVRKCISKVDDAIKKGRMSQRVQETIKGSARYAEICQQYQDATRGYGTYITEHIFDCLHKKLEKKEQKNNQYKQGTSQGGLNTMIATTNKNDPYAPIALFGSKNQEAADKKKKELDEDDEHQFFLESEDERLHKEKKEKKRKRGDVDEDGDSFMLEDAEEPALKKKRY